jgi:hypothetical protein
MTDFTQGGKLYRRYDDGRIGYFRVKPVLRIGEYQHVFASEPLADRPLRLERNGEGFYYWSMAKGGEYHWWLTIESTDGSKTGENAVRVSGTQTDANGTDKN